jgi:predicted DNA-binding protein
MTTACMKKDAQVVVRMPSELRDALKELATADKRTLASYITLVLDEHVRQTSGK